MRRDRDGLKTIQISKKNHLEMYGLKFQYSFSNFDQVITLLLKSINEKGGMRRKNE